MTIYYSILKDLWNGIIVTPSDEALVSKLGAKRLFKLSSNIEAALRGCGIKAKLLHSDSKIFVDTEPVDDALNVIRQVFGVAYVSPCVQVEPNQAWKTVLSMVKRLLEHGLSPRLNVEKWEGSLQARLREAMKRFSYERDVDRTVNVRVYAGRDICYVYLDGLKGVEGAPLGVNGRVVCLVSGGIDSPVAAWIMMRRGCPITALFAYFPMGGDESDLSRFLEVTRRLRRWHVGERMYVYIYKHDLNLTVFRKTAPRLTCVLCRRMMYRVANGLAEIVGAKAVVTGENLAQVASQTLQNLNVIDRASKLPVLRPLIGFNKEEVVRIAKRIGTYEASCMRTSSGCGAIKGCWARPPKPVTAAKFEDVAEAESKLDIEALLKRSVESLKELPEELLT